MAHKLFTFLLCMSIGPASHAQPEKKLAEAFIQSVAKNNFKLLSPYLINAASAKTAFGTEFTRMSPAKQAEAITKTKSQLQNKWAKVVSKAKSNNIDFSKLQLKQVLSGSLEGETLSPLLITYQYNGVEWDDLFLIVNKKGNAKFIIELPSDKRMFALNEDTRGKNLENLRQEKERNDPNVKLNLKAAVEQLQKLVISNDVPALYNHIVYSGEDDPQNRWKRTLNSSSLEDVESSKRLMEKLKSGLSKCDQLNYGNVITEKESEGIWYVINTTCGTQKHTFAFLKVNNVYVLGDMD